MASLINLVNTFSEKVQGFLAVISRRFTLPEQHTQAALVTALTQYVNIAGILFLVNYKFSGIESYPKLSAFLDKLPIFNGQFDDFTVEWYGDVGLDICITVLLMVFAPIGALTPYVLAAVRRCYDRGCKLKSSERTSR